MVAAVTVSRPPPRRRGQVLHRESGHRASCDWVGGRPGDRAPRRVPEARRRGAPRLTGGPRRLREQPPDLVEPILQALHPLLQGDQLGGQADHLAARREAERAESLVRVLLHALAERGLGGERLIEIPAERLGEPLGGHRLAERLRPGVDPLVQERSSTAGRTLDSRPPGRPPSARSPSPDRGSGRQNWLKSGAAGRRLCPGRWPRARPRPGCRPRGPSSRARTRPGPDSGRHRRAPSMPRCVMTRKRRVVRTPALPEAGGQPVGDPRPAMDRCGAPGDQGDVAPGEPDVGRVGAARVVDQGADARRAARCSPPWPRPPGAGIGPVPDRRAARPAEASPGPVGSPDRSP